MTKPAPEPFFDDVVIGFSLPPDENEADEDGVQAMKKSAEKSRNGKEVEAARRGGQWSSGKLIAHFFRLRRRVARNRQARRLIVQNLPKIASPSSQHNLTKRVYLTMRSTPRMRVSCISSTTKSVKIRASLQPTRRWRKSRRKA